MKHTKGPWTVERGRILGPDGWLIGNCPYTLGDKQDHANAALIAAAPELLALAYNILAIDGTSMSLRAEAQKVIAKAEGGDK
jgi:hypothetical protein